MHLNNCSFDREQKIALEKAQIHQHLLFNERINHNYWFETVKTHNATKNVNKFDFCFLQKIE